MAGILHIQDVREALAQKLLSLLGVSCIVQGCRSEVPWPDFIDNLGPYELYVSEP